MARRMENDGIRIEFSPLKRPLPAVVQHSPIQRVCRQCIQLWGRHCAGWCGQQNLHILQCMIANPVVPSQISRMKNLFQARESLGPFAMIGRVIDMRQEEILWFRRLARDTQDIIHGGRAVFGRIHHDPNGPVLVSNLEQVRNGTKRRLIVMAHPIDIGNRGICGRQFVEQKGSGERPHCALLVTLGTHVLHQPFIRFAPRIVDIYLFVGGCGPMTTFGQRFDANRRDGTGRQRRPRLGDFVMIGRLPIHNVSIAASLKHFGCKPSTGRAVNALRVCLQQRKQWSDVSTGRQQHHVARVCDSLDRSHTRRPPRSRRDAAAWQRAGSGDRIAHEREQQWEQTRSRIGMALRRRMKAPVEDTDTLMAATFLYGMRKRLPLSKLLIKNIANTSGRSRTVLMFQEDRPDSHLLILENVR
jgi:hypothetical protein